jgi:serine/threonine protein kinase
MKTRDAVTEIAIKSKLEQLDPDFQYFLYPYKMCIPEVVSSPENNINSCGINVGIRVRNSSRKGMNLPASQLLIFKDGGTDLSKLKPPKSDYGEYFAGFENLFAGLAKLSEYHIIHFDIKPPNLIGLRKEDGTYHLRFIDFGLTKVVKDFTRGTDSDLYWKNYPYWSFELKLLQKTVFRGKNVITQEHIDQYYDTMGHNQEQFPYWSLFHQRGGYKITPGWAQLMVDDLISGKIMVNDVLTSMDLFSLGRSLSEIYCRFTGHYSIGPDQVEIRGDNREQAVKEYNERLRTAVSIPLYRFIVKIINPIFFARPTSKEAAREFSELVPVMKAIFATNPSIK